MTRTTVTLGAFVCLLFTSTLATAEPDGAAEGTQGQAACCASCASQATVLERGRPPMPGEDGSGIDSCTLVNTSAEWDAYCLDNAIPECPVLTDAFFADHTVVAVAIDTVTPRACEGSADPLWKLDCVTTSGRWANVRVVKQRPGGWCLCTAIPQQPQRLFLANAVPKTQATRCRTCEEPHTIDCLR